MDEPRRSHDATRRELLDALDAAGREHSDATMLVHGAIAASFGLNPTDHKVVSLLQRHGPLTAGTIADRTGLTTGSVTALVDRLQRRGLVQRRPDPADRRRVVVEPDSDGLEPLHRYFHRRSRSLAQLYARYSDDELAIILDFLTRSTQRLRRDLTSLAPDADDAGSG